MNSAPANNQEFPQDVVQAIENGNMIKAVKLLREHTGLGLKQSKELVEAYTKDHPASSQPIRRGDSNGLKIPVIALIICIYLLYRFLFK